MMVRKNLALQPGMTFIEMMFVVMIIGIIAAIATPAYMSWVHRSRMLSAKQTIKTINGAINTYNMDTSRWPETLEDLVRPPFDEKARSKWTQGGYFASTEVPNDPWGAEFVYRRTTGVGKPYELFSYGPNGEEAPEEEWIRA